MQPNNPKSCTTKRDNRVWSLYNELLVKRMENLLYFSAIENIKEDLAKQNRHKVGRPFRLPDSIVEIFARIRSVFNAPFRIRNRYRRMIISRKRIINKCPITSD